MTGSLALIVDDEPDILELLDITLERMGVRTKAAQDLKQAMTLLSRHRFDLCLTDMRLPDGNGIDLVRFISDQHPDTPVAMITAHGNMESAIQALKAGAFDFVSKPVDLQVLRKLVTSALKLNAPEAGTAKSASGELLGISPAMDQVRSMIDKLARSQAPVYISGESGTGKELAARLIHERGPRARQAFVAVNCGAIPPELMESEFFGHRKGSFTGAVADKDGLFRAADNGTLFLDEVADLPMHMQVKLLRAIQEKRIRPVGGNNEIPADVRIISATHKPLDLLVENEEFRQDLYFRINVIQLHIPPLRERRDDIPVLVDHFSRRLAKQFGESVVELDATALQRLCEYDFPGNVRELENILERAITLADGKRVTSEDLSLPRCAPKPPGPSGSQPLEEYLENIEKQLILQALEETRWNRTAAAKKLGLSFRALRYRLSKLGLDKLPDESG